MLKKTKKGFWVLEKFDQHPKITHGFSPKAMGNMNPQQDKGVWRNIEIFLNLVGFHSQDMVLAEQIHKNKVAVVGENEKGKIMAGVDGMVTCEKGVILGVRVADCLPVLFYDPGKKIVGVAHAGWQGIVGGVVSQAVKKMKGLGSRPVDILVGIGPRIGGCCYTIGQKRARIFRDKFGDLPGMIYEDAEGLHLDLVVPAVFQLEKMGVRRENIEVSLTCTSCQNQDFFSFRREKTEKRILGVIGLR